MKNRKVSAPKLVYGIGINDADYAVVKWRPIEYANGQRKRELVWICPFYRVWQSMLMRCYSTKYQERYPTYIGCTVSGEWLLFSNFRAWMDKQDWEGMQLDKDLLLEGNKVYGAEKCVFVSRMVNIFTIDRGNDRGEWLIGVDWYKRKNKFRSSCSNPFTKKREHLGYFTCEQEAHQEWLKRKLELAYELAAIQTDQRVAKALIKRYSKYKQTNESTSQENDNELESQGGRVTPPRYVLA